MKYTIHQVKGNLEETMAKKVMEGGSDIQGTVEDVNVTDVNKYGYIKIVVKKQHVGRIWNNQGRHVAEENGCRTCTCSRCWRE